ncbi:MAG: DUF2157 domain-containing protein [Clostridia bacterium]|jgi:uncharacterized membrane protein|nr:DUF2157 domain-containing protein [Clostridia bacterium]
MQPAKYVKWLYSELPELMKMGVLTPEAAAMLQSHYGNPEQKGGRSVGLIIGSILGAVLIGLGIILLLANNWPDLSRLVRTYIIFSLLFSAQGLAGWAFWYKPQSLAWREGTATFLVFAVGAAIALIGQTYHLPGDLGSFLLIWMLLILPLAYLMNASLPLALYLAGILWWLGYSIEQEQHLLYFWVLTAVSLPYLFLLYQENTQSVRLLFLKWLLAVWVIFVLLLHSVAFAMKGPWMLTFGSLFTLMYLAETLWYRENLVIWRRPFTIVGALGISILTFVFTFREVWPHRGFWELALDEVLRQDLAIPFYLLSWGLPLASLVLLVIYLNRRDYQTILLGIFPVVILVGLIASRETFIPLILSNLYFFILAASLIIAGLRQYRLSIINLGMLMMGILILARFFDSNIAFVVRAIIFIALGIGFLSVNLWFHRDRGSAA